MTNKEALEILDHNWTRLVNSDYTDIELGQAQDTAIKALEVVDKIKKAFIESDTQYDKADILDCNNCTHFTGETYNILCDAYGTEESMDSWIKETENE